MVIKRVAFVVLILIADFVVQLLSSNPQLEHFKMTGYIVKSFIPRYVMTFWNMYEVDRLPSYKNDVDGFNVKFALENLDIESIIKELEPLYTFDYSEQTLIINFFESPAGQKYLSFRNDFLASELEEIDRFFSSSYGKKILKIEKDKKNEIKNVIEKYFLKAITKTRKELNV